MRTFEVIGQPSREGQHINLKLKELPSGAIIETLTDGQGAGCSSQSTGWPGAEKLNALSEASQFALAWHRRNEATVPPEARGAVSAARPQLVYRILP